MREKELEYLRNELNQRLNFSYEHSNKLIGHILLVWGGTLLLFSKDTGAYIGFDKMLFIMATIFFISVVVIFLLSHRNSENMIQFSKIAAYIAIFHEKIPHYREHDRISWELVTFEINKNEMGKTWLGKLWNKVGNEYFWLSSIATGVIFVIFFCVIGTMYSNGYFSGTKYKEGINLLVWVLMFLGFLVYIVISMILSFVILLTHLSLNWEKWSDKEREYLRSFLEYAIKNKHYTAEDINERYGEDFYDEIVHKKLKKVLDEVTAPYYEREPRKSAKWFWSWVNSAIHVALPKARCGKSG
ncbi:hypothetical protein R80B4_01171 [Fibrobacteres bacterium R8-0-B4]